MQASPSRAIMMPLLPLSALALAAAAAPPVDLHCQARLDAWCNCAAHCSAGFPTHAPLAALHGRNRHNTSKAWRCYPVSELNADRSAFVPDPERSTDHICTEAERLPEQLKLCGKTPPAPSPACPTPPPGPPAGPLPLLPGVSFITRVFVGGTGGCVMYRTPSLLNVGNGVLLAFTQCRQVSRGDASPEEIHLKTSQNSGRSWGAASVLPFSADPKHNSLHRAQTIFDAKTGAIFLFDDALPYPTTKHVSTRLLCTSAASRPDTCEPSCCYKLIGRAPAGLRTERHQRRLHRPHLEVAGLGEDLGDRAEPDLA
jgi:hypothetical protein